MKLGQTATKKQAPPRLSSTNPNEKESITMSTDTSKTTDTSNTGEDDDDDGEDGDDDDGEGGKSRMPRHQRFAKNIRVLAGRLVKREAGKGIGMRAWVDNAISRVEDGASKDKLVEAGKALDAAYAAAIQAADALDGVDASAVSRKRSEPGSAVASTIEIGAKVEITEKHVEKYSGVMDSTQNLTVRGFRKSFCQVETESGEGFFVPTTHIRAMKA